MDWIFGIGKGGNLISFGLGREYCTMHHSILNVVLIAAGWCNSVIVDVPCEACFKSHICYPVQESDGPLKKRSVIRARFSAYPVVDLRLVSGLSSPGLQKNVVPIFTVIYGRLCRVVVQSIVHKEISLSAYRFLLDNGSVILWLQLRTRIVRQSFCPRHNAYIYFCCL